MDTAPNITFISTEDPDDPDSEGGIPPPRACGLDMSIDSEGGIPPPPGCGLDLNSEPPPSGLVPDFILEGGVQTKESELDMCYFRLQTISSRVISINLILIQCIAYKI